MPAERRHTAECYRRPLAKKARLRAVAARHIAEHGLAGFNLHRLAPRAGLKFDLARHYYRTNQALIADIVHTHQAALGEALADHVLAARPLPGPSRLEALACAYLDALIQHRDGHRTAMTAIAALPGIAESVRRGDLWLHGIFADALQAATPTLAIRATERDILARSLLLLLDHWALRLDHADTVTHATCARLAAAMAIAGQTRLTENNQLWC